MLTALLCKSMQKFINLCTTKKLYLFESIMDLLFNIIYQDLVHFIIGYKWKYWTMNLYIYVENIYLYTSYGLENSLKLAKKMSSNI
jgi:hypothetical protein